VRFDTPRVAVTTRGETLLTRARHGSPLAQRSEELAERDVVVLERVPAQRAA